MVASGRATDRARHNSQPLEIAALHGVPAKRDFVGSQLSTGSQGGQQVVVDGRTPWLVHGPCFAGIVPGVVRAGDEPRVNE